LEKNVVYGMYSGLALLMDIHHPEEANGYGLVHISGSGWSAPLGLDARPLKEAGHVGIEAPPLVAAGYTVFTINHRAAPRFKYPAPVEDVQRAVRFVRHHAADYGIDPERIGAVGGSSGGHLVSMVGLLDGDGDPEDESPVNRESAKVQCVVARATPSDFREGGPDWFLGARVGPKADHKSIEYRIALEASPITHVSPGDPPFLLLHGDKDEIVPIEGSIRLKEALEKVGVPAKLITIVGAGHGPSFPGAENKPDLGAEMVKWMDTHLKAK